MRLYIFFSALALLALKLAHDVLPQVQFDFRIDWWWFWALLIVDAWLVYSVIFFLLQG